MTSATRPVRRLAVLCLVLLGLAACGGDDVEQVLTCPQVFIVKETNRYVLYAPGEGRDLIDVRYDADITNVEWLCNFFTDDNRLEMEVRFGMRALMGPAAEERRHRFPYFVAVADPSGNLVAKQVFGIDIGFPGNAIEVAHVESVFQSFNYSTIPQAERYTIYIGFQLDRQQLEEARTAADLR